MAVSTVCLVDIKYEQVNIFRVARAPVKRNLAIKFSRQGKHRKFKEFNKSTGNLDKAGKINNF